MEYKAKVQNTTEIVRTMSFDDVQSCICIRYLDIYYTKGQIISEQNCGVLNFPKRISALASKMGQIKKMKAL